MLFSDRGRFWKALAALLIFYAGCRYNAWVMQTLEPPLWACEGHPEKHEGRRFWMIAEKITAVDPEQNAVEVEPKGFRVRIQVPPGVLTPDVKPGQRLYATVRYGQESGFTLEPGAHTAPPEPIAHLALYVVSIPALAFVAVVFLRRFKPNWTGALAAREQADA